MSGAALHDYAVLEHVKTILDDYLQDRIDTSCALAGVDTPEVFGIYIGQAAGPAGNSVTLRTESSGYQARQFINRGSPTRRQGIVEIDINVASGSANDTEKLRILWASAVEYVVEKWWRAPNTSVLTRVEFRIEHERDRDREGASVPQKRIVDRIKMYLDYQQQGAAETEL